MNHPGPVVAIFKSKSELSDWCHYDPGEFWMKVSNMWGGGEGLLENYFLIGV